jgi:hypothetical protein
MSNHLAIAAVTETLKSIVQAAVSSSGAMTGAKVMAATPSDKIKESAVNICLYEVKYNPFLRNEDLAPGARPTVALNLRYLFSFYGDETKQEPQRLMGRVMSAIHAEPILDREIIREAIGNNAHIADSDLDTSPEDIGLSPIRYSSEEIFKLWSAFQAPFALSFGYEASVVLLENDKAPAAKALPVKGA